MTAYNFDLIIGRHSGNSLFVAASFQPEGTASEIRNVDLDSQPLAGLLQWSRSSVDSYSADLGRVEALGEALYQALFGGKVGSLLRLAQRHADDDQGSTLRVRLSTEDLTLLSVPWEFLYDRDAGHQFATDPTSPLVRYLSDFSTFGRPRPLEAEAPLRMLMAVPSVSGLDVQGEISRVQEALDQESLTGSLVELTILDGRTAPVTLQGLLDILQADQVGFDILHFSGHGDTRDGRGLVRFNDDTGGERWIDSGTLGRALKPFAQPTRPRHLRLAVLNSCLGGVSAPEAEGQRSLLGAAPALIQNDLAAVIAMQYEILDVAALVFARAFYRALTIGPTAGQVDLAVSDARNRLAVALPGHRSFATPVLFIHTEQGRIFELGRTTGAAVEREAGRSQPIAAAPVWLTPQDLEREIESRQERLRAIRQQPRRRTEIARLESELAILDDQLASAQRNGVPPFVSLADFKAGRLNPAVLKEFMDPLPTPFSALDVVRHLRHEAPTYLANIAEARLQDPNANDSDIAAKLESEIREATKKEPLIDRYRVRGNRFFRSALKRG